MLAEWKRQSRAPRKIQGSWSLKTGPQGKRCRDRASGSQGGARVTPKRGAQCACAGCLRPGHDRAGLGAQRRAVTGELATAPAPPSAPRTAPRVQAKRPRTRMGVCLGFGVGEPWAAGFWSLLSDTCSNTQRTWQLTKR